MRAMSQHPTLCDADQRCARTSVICQQKLWLCHKYVSQCLRFSHKYSISPSLFELPNGIGEYAVIDLYNDMPRILQCTRTWTIGQQQPRLCHEYPDTGTQYRLDCLDAKCHREICRDRSVITICGQDYPVHLNFNHMATKAGSLPQMSEPCLILRHKY